MTALNGRRGNITRVLALLRIPANLRYVGEVSLDLRRDSPTAFKVNIRLFLWHLAIFADGEPLPFQLLRDAEMQMDEDYKEVWLKIPERNQKYRAIIGIHAERFIEVVIHLHHFGDSVFVHATDTEVKFTTVNKEIVIRKQDSVDLMLRLVCSLWKQ